MDADTQQFLLWAWHHREELNLNVEVDIPAPLRQAFQQAAEALALFHRSSSLAEALHSWLRPFLQIHRGMPAWLLPLLQFYWNHHRFSRGKRADKSPLELAGVENALPLSQALMTLLPQPA
ncbi:hypothetical protein D6779_01690 [Candidatus Parcubacteria bacterium]|nr:MAG: hypothetical protein D6779_01690 [Candidatus Parcubacteria bacterium]